MYREYAVDILRQAADRIVACKYSIFGFYWEPKQEWIEMNLHDGWHKYKIYIEAVPVEDADNGWGFLLYMTVRLGVEKKYIIKKTFTDIKKFEKYISNPLFLKRATASYYREGVE
jgi:hypothetical protein